MSHYARILVPIDFSDYSTEALQHARELASRFNSELHLLTITEAWPPATAVTGETYPLYRDYVLEANAKATGQLNELATAIAGSTPIRHAARSGHVEHEILKYIEEEQIDLVVLGTHGRTGLSHWLLGSVAEKVVRHATCPVMVVRRRPEATASAG